MPSMPVTLRLCADLLPGHQHCRHGHTEDCPDPGECPLIEIDTDTEPPRRRLCAHADDDGHGMHVLEPGEHCTATPDPDPDPDYTTPPNRQRPTHAR